MLNEFAAISKTQIGSLYPDPSAASIALGSTRSISTLIKGMDTASFAVRPENLWLTDVEPADDAQGMKANLKQKIFAGPTVTCLLEWQGQDIKVLSKEAEVQDLADSGEVWINWNGDDAIRLPSA